MHISESARDEVETRSLLEQQREQAQPPSCELPNLYISGWTSLTGRPDGQRLHPWLDRVGQPDRAGREFRVWLGHPVASATSPDRHQLAADA
jgi:hypothetical protein